MDTIWRRCQNGEVSHKGRLNNRKYLPGEALGAVFRNTEGHLWHTGWTYSGDLDKMLCEGNLLSFSLATECLSQHTTYAVQITFGILSPLAPLRGSVEGKGAMLGVLLSFCGSWSPLFYAYAFFYPVLCVPIFTAFSEIQTCPTGLLSSLFLTVTQS